MHLHFLALGIPALLAGSTAISPGELAKPIRLKAADSIIDVSVGHAAPTFSDFDGDGKADLLVGQFGGGHLRIYRNIGTATAPKFAKHTFLQAGGKKAKVPAS